MDKKLQDLEYYHFGQIICIRLKLKGSYIQVNFNYLDCVAQTSIKFKSQLGTDHLICREGGGGGGGMFFCFVQKFFFEQHKS